MKTQRSRIKLAIGFVLVAVVGILLWKPLQQACSVAAVQNAVDRGWEITFGEGLPPRRLPEWLNEPVEKTLQRVFDSTRGYDGSGPAVEFNRDDIHLERFYGMFRNPIDFIGIYYPEHFRADELGPALARFPQLRKFEIIENESSGPSEVEWTKLCEHLRALPKLEEIELGGYNLTDAAIAPLAGHPGLHHIMITEGDITPACTGTFTSIPHLRVISLGTRYGDSMFFKEGEQDAITQALPGVKIEFPVP